jgi:replication factor A1
MYMYQLLVQHNIMCNSGSLCKILTCGVWKIEVVRVRGPLPFWPRTRTRPVTPLLSLGLMYQLTSGSCVRIHNATSQDDPVFNDNHVLQILSIKPISPPAPNAVPRFRIILSDGLHYVQAMLATQLNQYVQDQQIQKHSIIQVSKMSCNTVQNKQYVGFVDPCTPLTARRLIIVLALDVVGMPRDKINDPKSLSEGASSKPDSMAAPVTAATSSVTATASKPVVPQQQQNQSMSSSQLSARTARANSIYPIEALSPYQNNWTIKARVTSKSEVKHWSNQRGEGKLFNVTLMDESGEIKATGFNDAVEMLYDKLQEGKVYFVSKARVNLARKKFSNLANDYELSFERQTEVEEVQYAP